MWWKLQTIVVLSGTNYTCSVNNIYEIMRSLGTTYYLNGERRRASNCSSIIIIYYNSYVRY